MIKKKEPENPEFVFYRANYILWFISIALVIIGYLLMMGGGSDNPAVFNPEIFSFRRITLAPAVVMAGYITAMFAIMKGSR